MSRLERLKNKEGLVYSRTEETKEPVLLNKFYVFLVVLGLGGLVYLFLFSGIFNVKKVDVSDYTYAETVKKMTEEEVAKNIFSRNIVLFNTTRLKTKLAGDPNIKNIIIKKQLPATVRIEIEESRPALVWISAGDKMLVDDRGVIIGRAENNNSDLPEINDASNIQFKTGERVASPTFILFINNIRVGFEPATGVKLIKITLFDVFEDVHVLSSAGWTVYFNATFTADAQLKNLARVLGEAAKTGKKLEYIDMRLDNKIFYK